MRIAAITASFLPHVGGAEFAVHHLARQWASAGHEVTVFNQVADAPSHPEANYEVRRYKTLRGMWRFARHRHPFSWYATRQLDRALRDFRPDFISAHFGYPVGIWLANVRPVPPFLITCHGPALDERPQGVRRRYGIDGLLANSLNSATGVVAISSHARRVLVSLGVRPEKVVEIPNGVEVARFRTRVPGFDLRRRLNLPEDALLVLSVGRDTPEKGYPIALRAFAVAASRHPRLHYALVGRNIRNLQSLAHELGIAARVRFEDGLFGEDLIGAYQQADIFMLSSVKELCPLVVPEAMAAGLPELVTDVSGAQDMVLHEGNGLVVEPGNPQALADALDRLAGDPALRRRMAEHSLRRAPEYDWARLARLYLEQAPRR